MAAALAASPAAGAGEPEPEADAGADLRANLSLAFGPMLVGRDAYVGAGPDLEAGHRLGPVWLMARGSWMGVDSDPREPTRGAGVWRYGGAVRVSLGHILLDRAGFGLRLWADGGLGRRVIHWDGGGRLASREWALGVGWEGGARIAEDDPRSITIGMGIRALFAEAAGGGLDPAVTILMRVGWAQ